MDWSPLGLPVCGILQAKILEWIAVPFSRGSERKSRSQMPFLAVHPPAFDVTGYVKDCFSELPKHNLSSTACSLSAFGGPTTPPSLGKPPFRIQKLFRRGELSERRTGPERHSANRLLEMKELRASVSTPQPLYFPGRESHSGALWGKGAPGGVRPPPTRHQPPRPTPLNHSPAPSLVVMSFYLKSTFNTSIVSQIQVFTLYSTKVFEYYSLYKMEPYKNTGNLMFLYNFL